MDKHTNKNPIKDIIFVTCVSFPILLSLASLIYYRVNVGGTISNNSQDWSDFGSFSAGVLAPAIALSALIAFIVGVQLQYKEMRTLSDQVQKSDRDRKVSSMYEIYFNTLDKIAFIEVERISKTQLESYLIHHDHRSTKALHLILSKFNVEKFDFRWTSENERHPRVSKIVSEYHEIFIENQYMLANYLRTIYHFISYLKSIDNIEEAKLFKAQLSTPELILIFLNTLTTNRFSKMRDLVIEFEMLEHLPESFASAIGANAIAAYPREAYGVNAEKLRNLAELGPQ